MGALSQNKAGDFPECGVHVEISLVEFCCIDNIDSFTQTAFFILFHLCDGVHAIASIT